VSHASVLPEPKCFGIAYGFSTRQFSCAADAATRNEAQRYVGLAPLVKRADLTGWEYHELETCGGSAGY
jgi:hypothetical protein